MMAISTLAAVLTYVISLCGIAPLFPWLTIFPRIFLIAGLLFGVWQDRKGSWRLKPWMQNGAIVPVFIFYFMQFSRVNPVQPVVSALAIMLAVRLSGEKTVRHSMQIYVLSLFCLASSSLFDLSPLFLIYLAVMLFLVALALVLLTFQDQDPAMKVTMAELKRVLFSALMMPVLAVPLLLLFFPIMPRTQLPLWNFLNPSAIRTSGYSDAVEPGSQSSIAESHSLVFRAEMQGVEPDQLYWRATVFNHTDGNKWTRTLQIPSEEPKFTGQPVKQIIYPEPSGVQNLIALDRPVSFDLQRVYRSPDGVSQLSRYSVRRVSYGVNSQIGGFVPQNTAINRQFYLQLPDRLSPRVKDLARSLTAKNRDDSVKIELLENYFRNGGYRYATSGLATGDGAIEQFLFTTKQGHCEFFASSFALLLRAAGVPCRLVGGYLGGEYNRLGGYYLVADDKAHVWVEAYLAGKGWVRIDPSRLASNAGQVWRPSGPLGVLKRISLAIDSFNHTWNRSVIAYDFEKQVSIVSHIGARWHGFDVIKAVRKYLPYLAGFIMIAITLCAVIRSTFFISREQRILKRFLAIIEQKFTLPIKISCSGLFEIAAAVNNSDVSDFVAIYASAVYQDRRLTGYEYQSLLQILKILKGLKSQKP